MQPNTTNKGQTMKNGTYRDTDNNDLVIIIDGRCFFAEDVHYCDVDTYPEIEDLEFISNSIDVNQLVTGIPVLAQPEEPKTTGTSYKATYCKRKKAWTILRDGIFYQFCPPEKVELFHNQRIITKTGKWLHQDRPCPVPKTVAKDLDDVVLWLEFKGLTEWEGEW